MKKKLLIMISIVIIVLSVGGIYYYFNIPQKENKVEEKKEKPIEKQDENYSFSFIAFGDALIHDGVYIDANTGKKNDNGYYIYDFTNMFTYVKEIIEPYDLKFYNQETVIGGKNLGLSGYPNFNSPDEIGTNLMDIGFNIVNLASNHTMDKGVKGATYSAQFWENKDVYSIGSYTSKEKKEEIIVKEKNNITYSILSYTYGTNGIPVPKGYEYLVNVWPTSVDTDYQLYKDQVKKDIEAVRDKVDILMVSMHWGTEYTHIPNNYQKDMSEYLSNLGVDVIIGHHPHTIQPIEYVNDTLVIYSLGNMISAQDGINKRVGLVASFIVNKEIKDGKTKIEINDVKGDLIWTYQKGYKNFKVIPFNKLTNSELAGYQNIYNEYIKHINPNNDDRVQVGFFG